MFNEAKVWYWFDSDKKKKRCFVLFILAASVWIVFPKVI